MEFRWYDEKLTSGGKGVKNGDVENSFHIHYIFESSQPRVEAAPEEATLEIARV